MGWAAGTGCEVTMSDIRVRGEVEEGALLADGVHQSAEGQSVVAEAAIRLIVPAPDSGSR